MAREINLLPEKEQAETKLVSLQKKLIIISSFLLILLGLATVGVFVFWQQQINLNKKVEADIDLRISQIQAYQRSEVLLKILKDKTAKLGQLISGRRNYHQIITGIESLIGEGVSVSDIQLTKEGKVVFTGSARNSFFLSNFLLGLIDTERGGKVLTDVSIDKLSGSKDGTYQFGINAQIAGFKKEPKPEK